MVLRPALLVLAAALALGACGGEPPTTPTPRPLPDAPPPPKAPVNANAGGQIQPGLQWNLISSGEGVALALSGPDGARQMSLGCTRNPAGLTLTIDGFTSILSEERLTFGLGDELFVFVAEPSADRPRGVRSSAPVSRDFLNALPAAPSVGAAYGAQQFGPHMPPPPDMARTFAADCQETPV